MDYGAGVQAGWGRPRGSLLLRQRLRLRLAHVPGQAQCAKSTDGVPARIELVPDQAMTRELRVRVVVVVPALTPGQQRNPKAVPGSVRSSEAPCPPEVRG